MYIGSVCMGVALWKVLYKVRRRQFWLGISATPPLLCILIHTIPVKGGTVCGVFMRLYVCTFATL